LQLPFLFVVDSMQLCNLAPTFLLILPIF
jgi:hypothetical protein